MLQPNALNITAQYSMRVSEKKQLFVNIHTSDKGRKVYMNLSTALPSGGQECTILPDELETVANFVKDVDTSFKQLVQVKEELLTGNKE